MAKKKRYHDPHAAREAQRYEHPVPSRELILQLLNDLGKPTSSKDLFRQFGLKGEQDREAFTRRLKAMLRDGQLVQNRAGNFGIAQRMDLLPGRVQGHRDGFGFVIPDEADEEDLFLSPWQMKSVMDGDRVLVAVEGRNRFGKREARVVEVTDRATRELVGVYQKQAGVHFLEPQNRRITRDVLITELNGLQPRSGDHVRAEIIQYPGEQAHILVRLAEIIASPDEPGMEVDVALRAFDVPHHWPEETLAQAQALPDKVLPKDGKGRVDLRDLPLVTIDGEDARDFDDAVYVEARKGGGWRLVVAIADVSHYVWPGSALDDEARKRATSVYFPNRVVPMLPEKLSNGLCSLNPHVDRLCLFADIQIGPRGRVGKFRFCEGIMRSRHRLTYTQVGAFIEEPESAVAEKLMQQLDDESQDMIWHFYSLYSTLREQRDQRGAIDFETVETRILYDDNKKISAIVPVTRNVAHKMIEEAMLTANICAARLLEKAEVPALFRNHEAPSGDKLETLQAFLGPLGLSLDLPRGKQRGGDPTPAMFRSLTEAIEGRPDRSVIQVMMLRSLTQAKYEAENKGHFGLAYPAYTHFTSPIRRYPDLLVHRAIRFLIREGQGDHVANPGKLPRLPRKRILPYETADMVTLGEHCSMAERRADDASRDVVRWLKCQYMQQHLGDTFEGVVSGVAAFGLFVELQDLYIEGMVHVSSLDSDYYHYDEVRHALVGESSGRKFRLGDQVKVQVAAVNIEDRKIDLQLVQQRSGSKKGSGSVRAALAKGQIPGGKRDGKPASKGDGRGKGASSGPAAARKSKGPPRGKKARRRRS